MDERIELARRLSNRLTRKAAFFAGGTDAPDFEEVQATVDAALKSVGDQTGQVSQRIKTLEERVINAPEEKKG